MIEIGFVRDIHPFFHPPSPLLAPAQHSDVAEARARNTVSYEISPYGVNLPSALNLPEAQIRCVCESITACLGAAV